MNKKLIYLLAFICLSFVANQASAQITNPLSGGGVTDFPSLFSKLTLAFMGLITALGTLMVMVAGIMYLISAGNPGRMQSAKTALGLACVGILIGLSGSAIVETIKNTTAGSANIPAVLGKMAAQIGALIGGLSTIMLIISGIFFLFSAGDPQKMQTAKNILTYSIVGIIIGGGASAIVAAIIRLTA